MLLLQAPTAAIGCEAGALQEDTEAPSHEAAAHKATSVDSSPDVSLAPEVAWAQERLSEDDARLARLAPVRASDVKVRVGVTMLAGLLQSAAMLCHESVTFFIFRDWGIVQCQKIKLRQILLPTCEKT